MAHNKTEVNWPEIFSKFNVVDKEYILEGKLVILCGLYGENNTLNLVAFNPETAEEIQLTREEFWHAVDHLDKLYKDFTS